MRGHDAVGHPFKHVVHGAGEVESVGQGDQTSRCRIRQNIVIGCGDEFSGKRAESLLYMILALD